MSERDGLTSNVTTFTIQLSNAAYQKLERLRKLTGKDTLEETIEAALKLYIALPDKKEQSP